MKPGVANKVHCHFKTGFRERLDTIIDPQNRMGVMEKARFLARNSSLSVSTMSGLVSPSTNQDPTVRTVIAVINESDLAFEEIVDYTCNLHPSWQLKDPSRPLQKPDYLPGGKTGQLRSWVIPFIRIHFYYYSNKSLCNMLGISDMTYYTGLRAVPVIQFIIMILELLRRFGMDVNFEDIVVTEDSHPVAAPAPLLRKAS